jgi:hypothetical protein
MFKILLSMSVLYSFSIAEEMLDPRGSNLKPLVEKNDATQDILSALPSPHEITEPVSALESEKVIYLLTLNSPTAQIMEVSDKSIKEPDREINLCLNNNPSRENSSLYTPSTGCLTPKEDTYFKSYLQASQIFPIPD